MPRNQEILIISLRLIPILGIGKVPCLTKPQMAHNIIPAARFEAFYRLIDTICSLSIFHRGGIRVGKRSIQQTALVIVGRPAGIFLCLRERHDRLTEILSVQLLYPEVVVCFQLLVSRTMLAKIIHRRHYDTGIRGVNPAFIQSHGI